MDGMKQSIRSSARKTLSLARQTVRNLATLSAPDLQQVQGGQMHTSFSCGNNLCTTHG
jgi:hypothetical protein